MTALDARLPVECQSDSECRLLHELREHPALLAAADAPGPELSLQRQLRKDYPDDLVRLALLMCELRRRAKEKFSRAERMWFDRVGLEQATPELVARSKAARFPDGEPVWDLCSGIGGDTLALAGRGPVVSIDSRPAACLRTLWNAEAYDVADRVELRLADATRLALPPAGLIHIDPDRRPDGSPRFVRLEDYVPDLASLQSLTTACRGGAIKVGPASNFGGKFHDVEIELVSLKGECKEATVWFGSLAGPHPYRATLLPSGATLAGHPLASSADVVPLAEYLYDPDPAVVRAGLVDLCAEQLGLLRLDSAEEYLTSARLVDSPFVTPFLVLAELPNNERDLRQHLRERNGGTYEIKCRHVPVPTDALRRRLPRTGDESLTIFVARLSGKTRIVVTKRVVRPGE